VNLAELKSAVLPVRQALLGHAIYADLDSRQSLRVFMQSHVFAVWDFMSLLKALQRELCPASVPWIPPRDSLGARLVNEITLAEESDDDGQGGFTSHFEMYRAAMIRLGADTVPIDDLLDRLRRGQFVGDAAAGAKLPKFVRKFIGHTFDVIASRDPCRIAAAFTFGREDLLPDVFARIVDRLSTANGDGANQDGADPDGLEAFKYYLLRHVELDGDLHGPMAHRLVGVLCGADERKWQAAAAAAQAALEARLDLWNAIHGSVQECRRAAASV
jgi:hypothetical protein